MLDKLEIAFYGIYIKIFSVILLFGILFAYTLPWISKNSHSRKYSGVDFHGYWYAGHYIRMGVSPYWTIFSNEGLPLYWDPRYPSSGAPSNANESLLRLPIRYLDGHEVEKYPVAQVLIVFPSATAPLTTFMGLFSWLSWLVARTIWLWINIVLALLIPWLGFRLLRDYINIDTISKLILALAFYNFYGLRQCLVVGQQSIISLFLLLLAMLVKDRWLLAGVLLGFGISKYSVGLPVFLFFVLQRRTRIIAIGLLVQFLGMLLLTPLKYGSLVETANAYLQAISLNFSQEGVHLLARFSENQFAGYLFSVLVIVLLVYSLKKTYFNVAGSGALYDAMQMNFLNLLTVGLFLAVYHRIHDLPFMVFFILSMVAIQASNLTMRKTERLFLALIQLFVISMLIFPTIPGRLISYLGVSPEIISTFVSENAVSTVVLLLIYFSSIWIQVKAFAESKSVALLEKRSI